MSGSASGAEENDWFSALSSLGGTQGEAFESPVHVSPQDSAHGVSSTSTNQHSPFRFLDQKSKSPESPASKSCPKNRTNLWCDHITIPLAPLRAARGEITKRATMGVLFQGTGSEHVVWTECQLPYDLLFAVDNKNAAFNFTQANCQHPRHYFVEARDLFKDLKGRCVQCGDGISTKDCSVDMQPGELDHLQCSVTCCPYSKARNGRGQGTDHCDKDLVTLFYTSLDRLRPKTALFENVAGFGLPESACDKRTPLQEMLAYLSVHFPEYLVTVYFLDGETWYQQGRRHRIYVSLINSNYSPPVFVEAMRMPVQARNCTCMLNRL